MRLREGMDHQEVPEELQLKVRGYVEEETHPRARTLAIFADGEGLFEVYRVQADLPESVRYGEPNVSPILLALDDQEPYGAALVDAERFRYFVVSPLEGSEEDDDSGSNGYREVDVSPGSPGPRSGMDQEPDSRRTEANVSQFYNEVGGVDPGRNLPRRREAPHPWPAPKNGPPSFGGACRKTWPGAWSPKRTWTSARRRVRF